jgi:putative membrane protein
MNVHLPTVNAGLNGLSAVFLAAGYFFIRRKNVPAHRACMTAAFVTSAVFLVSYLYHHAQAGVTRYAGLGWARTIYFLILSTHTILAVAIVPLALTALWKAWRKDFDAHRRWARVAWPLWMYVSITGVIITWMLYYRK